MVDIIQKNINIIINSKSKDSNLSEKQLQFESFSSKGVKRYEKLNIEKIDIGFINYH